MQTDAINSLEARLATLESRQRRWRSVALLAAGAAVMPWVMGAARPSQPATQKATQQASQPATQAAQAASQPASELRGSSLTLVGPDGADYAVIRLEKGSPVLFMHQDGRHVQLTLADQNAGLACGGPKGVVFAGVGAEAAYFNARGSDLKTGVFAGVDDKLTAAFRGYGSDMQVAASIDVAGGKATLTLTDPKSGVFQLPASAGK